MPRGAAKVRFGRTSPLAKRFRGGETEAAGGAEHQNLAGHGRSRRAAARRCNAACSAAI